MIIEHNNIIYNFMEKDILIQCKPYEDGRIKFQPQTYGYLYCVYSNIYGIVYHRKTDRLYRTVNKIQLYRTVESRIKPSKNMTHEFDSMIKKSDLYESHIGWNICIYGTDIAHISKVIIEQYIVALFSNDFKKQEAKKRFGVVRKTQKGYVLSCPAKIYDYCIDNKCSLHDAIKYVSENPNKFTDNGKMTFKSEIIVGSEKMKFEKTNKNSKGVDFIKVYIPVLSKYTEPDNKKIIEIYKREKEDILKDVIRKIKESKRFANLGVPINIFRLTNVTLTSQRELYFLFELKEELTQRSDISE